VVRWRTHAQRGLPAGLAGNHSGQGKLPSLQPMQNALAQQRSSPAVGGAFLFEYTKGVVKGAGGQRSPVLQLGGAAKHLKYRNPKCSG
jgi:hypothetical protein